MNKRLDKEFGEHVAKKRGWHWALTSFAVEVWGETRASKEIDHLSVFAIFLCLQFGNGFL